MTADFLKNDASNFVFDTTSTAWFRHGTAPTAATTTTTPTSIFPLAAWRGCRSLGGWVQLGLDPLNSVGNSLDMVRIGSSQTRNVSIGDGQHLLHCVDPSSQNARDVHGKADGDEEFGEGGDLQVARFSALLCQQFIGHLRKVFAEILHV